MGIQATPTYHTKQSSVSGDYGIAQAKPLGPSGRAASGSYGKPQAKPIGPSAGYVNRQGKPITFNGPSSHSRVPKATTFRPSQRHNKALEPSEWLKVYGQ